MSESQYFAQRDQKNEEKLKAMLSALPSCCTDFFLRDRAVDIFHDPAVLCV